MSEFQQLRERVFGGENRLGWWTLPVFLAVGLFGAVVAGTLTVVYYSQQVSAIEEQTRSVREDLGGAVERVQEAAQQAIDEIEQQVQAVRRQVEGDVPALSPDAAGVVLVRVSVPAPPPPEPPPAEPSPQPPPQPAPPPDVGPTEPFPPAPSPVARLSRAQAQPDPQAGGERVGTAFAVARQGGATFFVTSLSLVRAPHLPGGTVGSATINLPGRSATATVHDWDENLDAAVLRADIGQVPLAEWRPPDEPLAIGQRLFALAFSPRFETIQLPVVVGVSEATSVLVTSMSPRDLPAGAPLLDPQGRLVGLSTPGYRPFGAGTETVTALPIRALCGPLLQQCGPQEG